MTSSSGREILTHRIKAVLTYMRGYASMLAMDGPLTPQQERDVAKIMKGIEELTRLIRELEPPAEEEEPPAAPA
ncbi:MAG: histidine kinase dimerization/phospho-acceptor domain-containing protein [Anaerolineae bacterium]